MVVEGVLTGNRQTNYGGSSCTRYSNLYSAVQYSTVQYSAVQYSTVQYSTVHRAVRWVGTNFVAEFTVSVFKVDRRKPRWKLVGFHRICGRKSNWLSSANKM